MAKSNAAERSSASEPLIVPKIFVSYTLRPNPAFADVVFVPDPAKKPEANAKDKEKFQAKAAVTPYLATFDQVYLFAPYGKSAAGDIFSSKSPEVADVQMCRNVRDWLLTRYPTAWADELFVPRAAPKAVFVGFNPRLFLKILGLECSLPGNNCPLPISMWYDNTDHRDLEEAVAPSKECGLIAGDWPLLARARGMGLKGSDLEKYNQAVKDWKGPGYDVLKDMCIAITWAKELGFLDRGSPTLQ